MGVARFDVLLRAASNGATVTRKWNKAELLKSIAWLKRMNARGNNVYVRPDGEHGLVLLDSLTKENLASMRSKGFPPVIGIEVNQNEFQAWVKLSDGVLPAEHRRLAKAGLSHTFAGEVTRVTSDGYGWLAGCANHGGSADWNKLGRYVLAHSGHFDVGQEAKDYAEYIRTTLEGRAQGKDRKAHVQCLPNHAGPRTRSR